MGPSAQFGSIRHWRNLAGAVAWPVLVMVCGGCASLIGNRAADTLSAAVLNQDDPQVVEQGLPAYLLIVDGLIAEDPDNAALLAGGAQLFALYGSRFVSDAEHAAVLTAKGRRYGQRAICLEYARACGWAGLGYDAFVGELADLRPRHTDVLYAYAVSWLSHLATTSSDWLTVAEIPWVQAALERLVELDDGYEQGSVHAYLGILNSLRPPALGGRPEVAKAHFEKSIQLSGGTDLSAKVEYARRYARMMFDQELHDRLLKEVLAAPVESPGLTLFNVLAKRDAAELLETSTEYF